MGNRGFRSFAVGNMNKETSGVNGSVAENH